MGDKKYGVFREFCSINIIGTLIIYKRNIKRIIFGWTAIGPVRIKALARANNLRREHAKH